MTTTTTTTTSSSSSSSSQPIAPPPPPLPLPPLKLDQEHQSKLINEAEDLLTTNVQLGNRAEIETHLHQIEVNLCQKFIEFFIIFHPN